MDTRNFTISECLCFLLKENKPTQGYLVFGLPVRGGHAIYLPKYNKKEKVFLSSHLLTVIQWGNTACICF